MQTSQSIQGQYFSLSASGIPKRCRKVQTHYIKGPFISNDDLTPEKEAQIIQVLKDRMMVDMKTVKTAYIQKNPASLSDGIMSHLIFSGQKVWESQNA